MRLALDTNRLSDLWVAQAEVVQTVESAEEVYVPLIVLGELRAGFVFGTRARENEASLRVFLTNPTVKILHLNEVTTHQYAAIYGQLRRQGTPIPTNDMWIAALVLQHGLTLYARDEHFDHLPQLMRI